MKQPLFTANFTLLILGQVSSLFGNYILKFALSMYVLEVTGSAAIFAGILALSTIPTIILSPLGGILADRANRRNIMVILDVLSGFAVSGAALAISRGNDMVVISLLLVILSVLGAFESPTVQACVPQMQWGDNLVKGNAVVSQVAAVAALVAPLLGSVVYVAFGLKPVMITSILCFFLTAGFECLIRLEYVPYDTREGVLEIIKNDCSTSMNFICKEQPCILSIMLFAALTNFFVVGIVLIGLPYIIRTILGLSANYYGVAESMAGLSAILGSIAAGLLTRKLKIQKLFLVLSAVGVFLFLAGMVFALPTTTFTKYIVTLLAFCGVQAAACIFSIFALSFIQQKTPNSLIGKVMAYISTITMCAQPLGQTIYGLLFDHFTTNVSPLLLTTGIIVCIIGLSARGFFQKLPSTR